MTKTAPRPQDVAKRKLEAARRQIAEKTRAMRRLVTSMRLWERRATHYAKLASMTDAEVAAAKAKRCASSEERQAARTRRGLKLQGGQL